MVEITRGDFLSSKVRILFHQIMFILSAVKLHVYIYDGGIKDDEFPLNRR